MLENTEGAIKNGKSRETGNIRYTRPWTTKTQHNMCWTSLYPNKQKYHKEDMSPHVNNGDDKLNCIICARSVFLVYVK
jgi:hypothetical protein